MATGELLDGFSLEDLSNPHWLKLNIVPASATLVSLYETGYLLRSTA